MSLYGAVGDGVFTFRAYARQQVSDVLNQANTIPPGASTEELLRRIDIMDHAKKNLDFANDVVDEILKNITSLQP